MDTAHDTATWGTLLRELNSTGWSSEDIDNTLTSSSLDEAHRAAAATLCDIFHLAADRWDGFFDKEDAPLAAVRAAFVHHNTETVTAGQVKKVADAFSVHYETVGEAIDEYLSEQGSPVHWTWLNATGAANLVKEVFSGSEVTVGMHFDHRPLRGLPDLSGVWVFSTPGH